MRDNRNSDADILLFSVSLVKIWVMCTTMTIKFAEFFIYIKILQGHRQNQYGHPRSSSPRVQYTWPSVSPIVGSNPGILQPQCIQGVGSHLFNFLHRPPVLVLHIFFDSRECPEVIWSQIW